MIVQLMGRLAGTPVYVNPAYVMTLRPEPTDPTRATVTKLRDGEAIEVQGEHLDVADSSAGPRRSAATALFEEFSHVL